MIKLIKTIKGGSVGYECTHEFNIIQEKQVYNKEVLVKLFREQSDNAAFALYDDGGCYESCKWYECSEDLANFSKDFVHAVFYIDWIGEDGEQGRVYAHNGKSYEVSPQILFPEFNEEKLR